jgi:transcriptional regulator GlxA family with amidase domain
MAPRGVVIVAFAGVQSLDVTCPLEVFDGANRWLISAARPGPVYRVLVATRGREPVSTSSGLGLIPHADLDGLRGPVDTLLVAGGDGRRCGVHDARLVEDIRTIARRARRVASVCTGAFLLAEAGLLDGLRATTHWAWCSALARDYPQVAVEADPIFVRDGCSQPAQGPATGG